MNYRTIEYPCVGSTYAHNEYGVYEYGIYPASSVLAGMSRRVFLNSFPTLAEAQAAFPEASVSVGSGFHEPNLNHLPDGEDI